MARIPEQEIERLKKEISLVRLAEVRGVSLSRSGDNLLGLCPFHDDREPSLVITPDKNLWHCLGACQTGGSVIDWVMRAEGASFRHAVELLRGGASLERSRRETTAVPKHSLRRKLEPIARADAAGAEVLERVVAHYHATLRESADAKAYLAHRGLSHGEVVEHFRLGFSNRTLGYKLPQSRVKDGAALRTKLMEVGVYRSSGHEHFTGCLVIPLFDVAGGVVGLYGRRIEKPNPGMPKHLYLPGPHRGVFNRQGLGGDEVIVCEALIDALTFWCAGLRNVTSGYGVDGVTDELVEALVASGTKRVMIAFDRDEAGDKGAEKLSVRLSELGIESFRVLFPRNMDANAYARKVSPAEKALELAVRQAVWMRGGKKSKAAPTSTSTTTSEAAVEMTGPSSPEIDGRLVELGPEENPSLVAEAAERGRVVAAPPTAAGPPSPAPAAALAAPSKLEAQGDERVLRFAERRWRVRPAGKSGAGELRANVMVATEGESRRFFVDTLDLYAARQRAVFLKHAAAELEVEDRLLSRELGLLVLELEMERDRAAEASTNATTPTMTDEERDEAMALLRDPRLGERLLEDLERAGIVGEETNKLVAYLAATSRKLDEPLAVVIQSSSAAGKSSLMEAVLSLIPEEDRVQYSAMTGQSLFYMGGQDLKHKVLAIVEEEGAERASYALKLLQSEGELTIASTGKEPATGRLVTQTYRVEGPVMIFLTTTAIEVDEELLNRCIVLSVDEGREQTRAIHDRQRRARTLAGQLEAADRKRIRRLYRNAQRLLRPVVVVNPFAEKLRFPDHTTRTRRDHTKYLTLISAVALLHQHQRPLRRTEQRGQVLEYIEATEEDVAVATRLAHAVLGRSLDELPPQTRRLLGEIEAMVTERMAREGLERHEVRFTRREVRERTQWGNTQLKVHMGRLEELEYLLGHRVRGPLVAYELRYGGEGKDGGRFMIGLEYEEDRSGSNGDRSGANEAWSGSGRPLVGPRSGGGRGEPMRERSEKRASNGAKGSVTTEIAMPGSSAAVAS
jgi:DNA primase catalytic core